MLTDSVAEIGVALVLDTLRNIVTAANTVNIGKWTLRYSEQCNGFTSFSILSAVVGLEETGLLPFLTFSVDLESH